MGKPCTCSPTSHAENTGVGFAVRFAPEWADRVLWREVMGGQGSACESSRSFSVAVKYGGV